MSDLDNIDDPIVKDLLPGYLERRREELVTLSNSLAAGDFEGLRTIGHNLHGSGGAYGLPRMSELGKALEVASRDHDEKSIRETLHEMHSYLDSLQV